MGGGGAAGERLGIGFRRRAVEEEKGFGNGREIPAERRRQRVVGRLLPEALDERREDLRHRRRADPADASIDGDEPSLRALLLDPRDGGVQELNSSVRSGARRPQPAQPAVEDVVGLGIGLPGEVGAVPPEDRELARRVAEEAAHERPPAGQAEELETRELPAERPSARPARLPGGQRGGDRRRGAAVFVADGEMEEEVAPGGDARGGQGAGARRADAG